MFKNRLKQALREMAQERRQEERQARQESQKRGRNGRFVKVGAEPRNGDVAVLDEPVPTPIEPVEPVEPAYRAVRLVLDAGGEPFCDVGGTALIRRPACAGRQRNRLTFPLKSSTTTGWIARLLFDAELPPLTKKELADALQILEGLAIDNEERVQCEDVVEQDIVLQTLAAMLRSELIPFHMTATMLLHKLQDYGIFSPNDPRWPADGARLTAHLWKSRQWLYELHIGYRYERLKGQRLHHFCPIWDVPQKSLDLWRPPQVAPIPANERRPFEENWREEDSPVVTPVVGEPQVTLADAPAASASPSASPPAPSANDKAAGSYGMGEADDAGDADSHHRPSAGLDETSAAPTLETAATPEPRLPTVSELVAAAMAANPERYPPAGWQDEPDEELEEVDLSGDDLDEPPPSAKPRKKYTPKFPNPNSNMRDWYRDAEAYINGDLDL